MKYTCIARHRGEYPVRLMCRVLQVARAGYYAWCRRLPSGRARANLQLLTAIRTVHQHSRATYGSPRITRELRAQGQPCSGQRVAHLMRLAGVQAMRHTLERVVLSPLRSQCQR